MSKEGERYEDVRSGIVVVLGVALAILAAWLVQQWWVKDIWRSFGYAPSVEMAEIQESLELTGKGQRIFAATRPALEGKTAFNEHCDSHNTDIALLGCYAGGQIFVYEIEDEELGLANNVTTAHELLHAVWERTSEGEKEKISELLEELMVEKAEWFEGELEAYGEDEKIEEVYTRAGTKLRDLPEELEKHYSEIFSNRAKIVEYFETYQAPFEELQDELEKLEQEILTENAEIEQVRTEYETRMTAVQGKVTQFNNCARTAGCFASDTEFQAQRRTITAEQDALEQLRETTNKRIEENNAKVEKYNELGKRLGELNMTMNSNSDI